MARSQHLPLPSPHGSVSLCTMNRRMTTYTSPTFTRTSRSTALPCRYWTSGTCRRLTAWANCVLRHALVCGARLRLRTLGATAMMKPGVLIEQAVFATAADHLERPGRRAGPNHLRGFRLCAGKPETYLLLARRAKRKLGGRRLNLGCPWPGFFHVMPLQMLRDSGLMDARDYDTYISLFNHMVRTRGCLCRFHPHVPLGAVMTCSERNRPITT